MTNLTEVPAKVLGDWYGRRMEVEELFKDLKNERTGFRLRGLVLTSEARYSRLLLLVAYAYYLLTVLGHWAEERRLHRRFMANTEKKHTLGLWRVGHYIFRSLASGRPGRPPDVFRTWPAAWRQAYSHLHNHLQASPLQRSARTRTPGAGTPLGSAPRSPA